MSAYRIGAAAQLSGVAPATIRYYEKEKLLAPHGRSANSYRFYSDEDIHRLRFIRLCRAMDMSLPEVRSLLAIEPESADHQACATLDAHLGHVQERLAELQALALQLQALRGRCDGRDAHCHVIEALHECAQAQPPAPARPVPLRHV